MPYVKRAKTTNLMSLDECCRQSQPCCWDDRSGRLVMGGKSKSMALGADENPGDSALFSWAKDVGQSIVGAGATAAQSVANIVVPPTAQTTASTPPAPAAMATTTKLAIAGGAVVLAALIFKKRG